MKHSKNEKMLNVLIKDTVLPTQIIAFLFAVATITVGKKDKRRKGLNNEKKTRLLMIINQFVSCI